MSEVFKCTVFVCARACVRLWIRESIIYMCVCVCWCMSVNNVHISTDMGGLLGYMCIRSLIGSCVSCPSTVALLCISCVSLALSPYSPATLCECRCVWECVCLNLHACKSTCLLCSSLSCYYNYAGRKGWKYSDFCWG